MWMDHRADEETNQINSTHHDLLKFVGGKVSLEMEMPKILWVKKVCCLYLHAYIICYCGNGPSEAYKGLNRFEMSQFGI